MRIALITLGAWATARGVAAADEAPSGPTAPPGAAPLEEVIVTASKLDLPLGEMTQPATVVTQSQLQGQAQIDMGDVLREQPGVQLEQNDVPGQFIYPRLRGFADSTLYVFDGIIMNQGGSGEVGFLLGQLDPSMVARIEVLRGPRATLYGANSTSGVIDFTTLEGDHPETDLSLEGGSVDWKKARIGTENALPLGDGTWDYSLNGSYSDSAGLIKDEYVKNGTLVGRTSYKTGAFEFGLSAYGTDNEFQPASLIESIPGATQANYFAVQIPDPSAVDKTKAGIASLWGEQQITATLSQKLTVGVATQDYTLTYGALADGGLLGDYSAPYDGWTDPNTYDVYSAGQQVPVYQSPSTYETVDTNKQADYNLRYKSEDASAVLGATYLGQSYDVSGTYGGDRESQSIRSLYGDATLGWLGNTLHTELGARLDDYSAWRDKGTYSLGTTYDIVKGLSLYANYGTSFTQPTLDQLYNPTYGNKTLTPENGSTIEGGLRAQQLDGQWVETVTVWHSYVDNVVIYDYDIYNPLVVGDYGRYQNVEAERSQGLELEASVQLTAHWTLTGNYTYTDANVTNASGVWQLMIENARDVGNLGLNYHIARFDLGANVYATSRRLRWAGDVWAPGYARLDAYGRLHVTNRFDLYARVQNVLDEHIVEILGYRSPGVYFVAGMRYRF
ncbi:MAG TPA: TonB-dependent receptor [Steroidobacteraceae bacterium]|nr:TonB-dependent receptor [Steroidobacteraceae bacterium]